MKINLKIQIYILKELLSPFILSLFVFLFTILMVQAFRFTDILLMSGGEFKVVLDLLKNLIVSTFPIILPLSLIAAILLGYGRLSQDSELIAFSSLGFNNRQLILPAFVLGVFVFYLSYLSVTELGPLGARLSKDLARQMQTETLKSSLKPGVFINVNDVTFYIQDIKNQSFKNVFILDQRNDKRAVILSNQGELIGDKDKSDEQVASYLRLEDGSIHFQPRDKTHATIQYDQYDLSFASKNESDKSSDSVKIYTNAELKQRLKDLESSPKNDKKTLAKSFDYEIEIKKRMQISLACIVFIIMGLSFGFYTFSRISRSESLGMCLGLSLFYWIVYFIFESLSFKLKSELMIYIPNLLFLTISILYLLYRNELLKLPRSKAM